MKLGTLFAVNQTGAPMFDAEGIEYLEDFGVGDLLMYLGRVEDDESLVRVYIPGVGQRAMMEEHISLV